MGTVCVEVAVADDRRVLDAVDSLVVQRRRPDRILIAASTVTPEPLVADVRARAADIPVTIARFPGGVVDARAGSLALIHEDATAFLDADERASAEWLERLLAPIDRGEAEFTAGPTRPLRPPTSSVERYNTLLEASIYRDLVPRSITYAPLQNTAWRTSVLRSLGFDPRIPFAEDHDLESRAARSGARGVFLPEAFVFHDPAGPPGLYPWARKRYRYLVAMSMSLMKNSELHGRLEERRTPVAHPLRYVESAMKPFALLHASVRWRRVRGATAG